MPKSEQVHNSIRILAAIMFTDMVGYTALMQKDEDHAIFIRNKHREVIQDNVLAYSGKILQYFGDGTLCMFSSAVQAVKAAVYIQQTLRNSEPPIPLRIGIHAGDIVHHDDGIYGNGVNIAARVESFGVAGSVLISGKVYDEIKNHPSLHSSFLGRYTLKNISKPIDIYTMTNEGVYIPTRKELIGKGKLLKPSIAILPFVNMSSNKKNQFISDSISEEIINKLTRIQELKVASRTSSFAYRGRNMDIREIGKSLNVDIVLEGSIRQSGEKIRVTAQLIEAESGYHIWSETYEEKLEDVFLMEDNVSDAIASKLEKLLQTAFAQKAPSKSPQAKPTDDPLLY